jgi:uroporphyrinogen decarboxylase
MTPQKFVQAAFNHMETGRVPLWASIHNRPVYEYILGPENVGDASEVSLDDKLRLHAQVYKELGIDIARAQIWPPDRHSKLKGETVWNEHKITAAEISDYVPKIPDDAAKDEEVDIRCRQIEINRPHTVFAPTIRGTFCPTFEKMGLEEFSYACTDSPDEVRRVMEINMEYARSMTERYAARKEVSVAAIVDDCAYKTGTIFPPQWMRDNWIPQITYIVEPLKKAGKKVVFHSDGKMDVLIPDLISAGIDGINPLEPLAGMDLAELKKQFGKDVTLIGGVDCSQLLPFGKPQEIRDEVKRLLDIGAPGGGFIIGDSSCILPDTPVENLLAFYETVHKYAF